MMKTIHKDVQVLVLGIMHKRMKEIEAGKAKNDDLLGLLLESYLNDIQQVGDKKSGMSMEYIIEECKLFYLSGQETTSALLVRTLILLSQHLDW